MSGRRKMMKMKTRQTVRTMRMTWTHLLLLWSRLSRRTMSWKRSWKSQIHRSSLPPHTPHTHSHTQLESLYVAELTVLVFPP